MSNILTVYDNLAKVTVTTTSGKTPKVYNLTALPESLTTAHLPCRLLLPLGGMPGEGRDGQFLGIGASATMQWQVNDLMFWQASEQGIGVREFAGELVDYCGKYAEAMKGYKCPASDMVLDGWSVTPGEFEYPLGSGRYYAAVRCQLMITEAI
jgi:hypothetical protein